MGKAFVKLPSLETCWPVHSAPSTQEMFSKEVLERRMGGRIVGKRERVRNESGHAFWFLWPVSAWKVKRCAASRRKVFNSHWQLEPLWSSRALCHVLNTSSSALLIGKLGTRLETELTIKGGEHLHIRRYGIRSVHIFLSHWWSQWSYGSRVHRKNTDFGVHWVWIQYLSETSSTSLALNVHGSSVKVIYLVSLNL